MRHTSCPPARGCPLVKRFGTLRRYHTVGRVERAERGVGTPQRHLTEFWQCKAKCGTMITSDGNLTCKAQMPTAGTHLRSCCGSGRFEGRARGWDVSAIPPRTAGPSHLHRQARAPSMRFRCLSLSRSQFQITSLWMVRGSAAAEIGRIVNTDFVKHDDSWDEFFFFFFCAQNDKENHTFKIGLDFATTCCTLTAQASKAVVTLNFM